MIKFAGDALFILFTGDRARAARRARRVEHEPRPHRDRRHPSARPRARSCGCRWASTPARSTFCLTGDENVSACSPARDTSRVLELQDAADGGTHPGERRDRGAAAGEAGRCRADRRRARTGCCARARSRQRSLMALSVGRTEAARALPPARLRPAPRPARRRARPPLGGDRVHPGLRGARRPGRRGPRADESPHATRRGRRRRHRRDAPRRRSRRRAGTATSSRPARPRPSRIRRGAC